MSFCQGKLKKQFQVPCSPFSLPLNLESGTLNCFLKISREDVGDVPLPADAFFPPVEMGDDVRQEPHGIERGEYGEADEVTEDDEHEKVVEMALVFTDLKVQFVDGHTVKNLADRFAKRVENGRNMPIIVCHGGYLLICQPKVHVNGSKRKNVFDRKGVV